MKLEKFVSNIKDFNDISASGKIDFFLYFLTVVENKEGVNSKEIESCFDALKVSKYSNISAYLKSNSKKIKNKSAKFILQNGLYHLERTRKVEIDTILNVPQDINPTNDYFPLELFTGTRGYLEGIAKQTAACYDFGLYDACAVMTRKLLETLIIEAFESHNIVSKIQDNTGNFFALSALIDSFKNETTWNIGRNAKDSIPKIKTMGDLSAHNRRYFSKKSDVDKLKDNLRIVFEELIHIIDFPNKSN
ncbi:DUF4145 domain-containing protein [Flavobacterium sp. N1736]|uniref:DUF4145 domain-containing protein n=1 Tax=Flavobacterium sp. N1736 TaxID=2986823 RepID=UPI002225A4D6|nr:DUF4145 domain-containing protein [Flavobacterium sp. N1736]